MLNSTQLQEQLSNIKDERFNGIEFDRCNTELIVRLYYRKGHGRLHCGHSAVALLLIPSRVSVGMRLLLKVIRFLGSMVIQPHKSIPLQGSTGDSTGYQSPLVGLQ